VILRNKPNFSAKNPMKWHQCPKKQTHFKANQSQFKTTGEGRMTCQIKTSFAKGYGAVRLRQGFGATSKPNQGKSK